MFAGTHEARRLCLLLAEEPRLAPVASLAGVTDGCRRYPVPVRLGPFGGPDPLGAYLSSQNIAAVVDATHPFASRIRHTVAAGASCASVPLLRLTRKQWMPTALDNWTHVADMAAAAEAVPQGSSVFLATGTGGIEPFLERSDLRLHLRVIDSSRAPTNSGDLRVHLWRPPYSIAHETALFRRLRITHLVVKNSGGALGFSKLAAARNTGVTVVMIERPAEPPCNTPKLFEPKEAMNWLRAHLCLNQR